MTGRAKIIGSDPLHLEIVPIGTLMADPSPYEHRYPAGSLVYDGYWYYGTYCLDEPYGKNILGPLVGFHISDDAGRFWQAPKTSPAEPLFGESSKYGGSVRFGARTSSISARIWSIRPMGTPIWWGMAHPARFVEGRGSRGTKYSWHDVRPDPGSINAGDSWEFFAGHQAGRPKWEGDLVSAEPIVRWDGHAGNVAVTWFPGSAGLLWPSLTVVRPSER